MATVCARARAERLRRMRGLYVSAAIYSLLCWLQAHILRLAWWRKRTLPPLLPPSLSPVAWRFSRGPPPSFPLPAALFSADADAEDIMVEIPCHRYLWQCNPFIFLVACIFHEQRLGSGVASFRVWPQQFCSPQQWQTFIRARPRNLAVFAASASVAVVLHDYFVGVRNGKPLDSHH